MTAETAEALIKKVRGRSIKQISALVEALKSVAQHSEPLPLFAPRPATTLDAIPSEVIDDTKTAELVAPSTLTVESCEGTNLTLSPEPSDPNPNTAKTIAPSTLTVTAPTKNPLPTSEQIEALTPSTVAEPAKVIRFTGENLLLYRKAEQRFGHLREEHLINRVFTVALRSDKPRTSQKRAYNTATRYIPNRIRQEVLERDSHRCTFVSDEGHRCSEQCGLQLDHFVPFSQGGASTVENLRAMCPAHNQLLAERALGKAFMERKRKQG
jgi:5-methylcytosine-specific restriction endonuclease McrA